jgi:hypothetical protein
VDWSKLAQDKENGVSFLTRWCTYDLKHNTRHTEHFSSNGLCVLLNDIVSNTDCVAFNDWLIVTNWKRVTARHYPRMCLEGLKKTANDLNHDSRCLRRDSKRTDLECRRVTAWGSRLLWAVVSIRRSTHESDKTWRERELNCKITAAAQLDIPVWATAQ